MSNHDLPIADLTLDLQINPRFKIDEKVIAEYAETPAREFPPIRVYRLADGRLLVSDGFHRVGAARHRGETSIHADVHEGTYEEAAEHAFLANVRHGKQLTRDEKTAAVQRMRELHPDWSHNQVAAALDLRPDRVREIYQAQEVREETGVHTLSQRRARAVANLPKVVAGDSEARRTFALTIERQGWSKDETEAALRTLKDDSVDDVYKRELLAGERPPLAMNDEGSAILLPETVARLAREEEARDATGALYQLISAGSELQLRLNETAFDHMSVDDVKRSLDRVEQLVQLLGRVAAELEAKLRLTRAV